MRHRPSVPFIVAALLLTTLIAYRHVGQCGFVNLDDDAYVESAPMVNSGVRSAALVWAVTSIHTANWHPLTSISHMIDCDLFGVKPAPMHWENVGWHLLNAVLVFLLWRRLTGTVWRSAVVAALFALHPLHVENVAWISSRKDLLCTLFWLLGLAAYVRWTVHPSRWRYATVACCLAVALLFKPMAVTFPAALLLLDGWPLRRWPTLTWRKLLGEKLPLFAMVALHSVVTFAVQHAAGAANYAERIPLGARLGNAVVSYARYLGKTVWPERLTPLYWHPGYWPVWEVGGAVLLLGLISLLVWRQRAPRPWLAFGWLWFLGTLVPVIGLVQVGAQAMADRYTYVPLLGVFTVVAWAGGEFVAACPRRRAAAAFATMATCGACMLVTQGQVRHWENSVSLYERSIASGEDNPAIRYLLGVALAAAGRPESEVEAQFLRAIAIEPDYVNAYTQLALIALRAQRVDEARTLINESIRLAPSNPGPRQNLGALLRILGRNDEAAAQFAEVLRLRPGDAGAHHELAWIALAEGRNEDARVHLEAVVRATPWDPDTFCELGTLAGNLRRFDEARRYLNRALWIKPDFARARENLRTFEQIASQKS